MKNHSIMVETPGNFSIKIIEQPNNKSRSFRKYLYRLKRRLYKARWIASSPWRSDVDAAEEIDALIYAVNETIKNTKEK